MLMIVTIIKLDFHNMVQIIMEHLLKITKVKIMNLDPPR